MTSNGSASGGRTMPPVDLRLAESPAALRTIPSASLDAVVTDPPAGIAFMGKEWDSPWEYPISDHGFRDGSRRLPAPVIGRSTRNPMCRRCHRHLRGANGCACDIPDGDDHDRTLEARRCFVDALTATFIECLRLLKPGGHALVWAIPRTAHWTATALENAGFEIRDVVTHLFGTGFPKSRDISKDLDRLTSGHAATKCAQQRVGWGTALKPASEHWILGRKPLMARTTVARNVAELGTGALNIDACRVPLATSRDVDCRAEASGGTARGRWPANVVLSHDSGCTSECVPGCAVAQLDDQSGVRRSGTPGHHRLGINTSTAFGAENRPSGLPMSGYGDAGGASRFFYVAKASRRERDAGLEHLIPRPLLWSAGTQSPGTFQSSGTAKAARNHHPTVKSIPLMRWLCRLVTPPGGVVLDPYMGSGSTGVACITEGFGFVGIERDADYFAIAEARVAHARSTLQPRDELREVPATDPAELAEGGDAA